jgi:hypothetical protein
MKASIAVATVSGKAYYLIVTELRRRKIPFTSLTPYETISAEVKAVLTTRKEKHLIKHEKILVYDENVDVQAMVTKALQIAEGKGSCEKLVIGIDPGEALGLAVIADGKVVMTETCSGVRETLEKVKDIIGSFERAPASSVFVKVGDGVPLCRRELLRALDDTLPQEIMLESVSEAGTSQYQNETKNRRGLRDMVSAIRIAGRSGHEFQRRTPYEKNS